MVKTLTDLLGRMSLYPPVTGEEEAKEAAEKAWAETLPEDRRVWTVEQVDRYRALATFQDALAVRREVEFLCKKLAQPPAGPEDTFRVNRIPISCLPVTQVMLDRGNNGDLYKALIPASPWMGIILLQSRGGGCDVLFGSPEDIFQRWIGGRVYTLDFGFSPGEGQSARLMIPVGLLQAMPLPDVMQAVEGRLRGAGKIQDGWIRWDTEALQLVVAGVGEEKR